MTTWGTEIASHTAWMGAAGLAATTIRLHRHYIIRLARLCPCGPWDATTDHLVSSLSNPRWAPETRKSARSALRSFYGWAMDTGRIMVDPARKLPPVRVPAGKPRPTPPHVVTAALVRADPAGQVMILLAVMAGLRRSEIATVHSDDVHADLTGLSLRVKGKGGRVRVVPLHDRLAVALAARPEGFVFPGKVGGHLSPQWVGQRLAKLLGQGWSGHTLRHRFSTDAYAVQRDLFAVQQLLGHSKPETTARYVQMPDDALRVAVRGLDAWAA